MDLLVSEVVERFYVLLWPMIRVSAFLLAAPFFSLRSVTVRIRVLLAALLTLMIYPLVDWPIIDPYSAAGLREIFNQVLIGTVMGMLLQIVNAALVVGGQAVSGSMGLGMANMVDPNMGNVPVISQFFIICSTLIFMGIGGHVLVISLILESFRSLPIGQMLAPDMLMAVLLQWSSMIFSWRPVTGVANYGLPAICQYRCGCYYPCRSGIEYFCRGFSRDDTGRHVITVPIHEQYWLPHTVVVARVL